MQALLEDLLPYLIAFYVLDALSNLRADHLLIASGPGGRFALLRGGLRLAGLWPGVEVIAGQAWPLRASARGVHLLDPRQRVPPGHLEPADLLLVPWESLAPIDAAGKAVMAGGQTILRAPSPAAARLEAERLRRIAATPLKRRVETLNRMLQEACDVEAVRTARARTALLRRLLQGASALLFAALFGLVPAVLYGAPQGAPLVPALVSTGALHLAIVALGVAYLVRAGAGVRAAMGGALHLLLLPPSAAHALVHLSRDLFIRFDPRALAAVVLSPEAFRAHARGEIVRLRHARAATAGGGLGPCWEAEERAWDRVFAAIGISRADLEAPPRRSGPDAASWCPICAAEYRAGFAECADCGVALEPFAGVPATAGRATE